MPIDCRAIQQVSSQYQGLAIFLETMSHARTSTMQPSQNTSAARSDRRKAKPPSQDMTQINTRANYETSKITRDAVRNLNFKLEACEMDLHAHRTRYEDLQRTFDTMQVENDQLKQERGQLIYERNHHQHNGERYKYVVEKVFLPYAQERRLEFDDRTRESLDFVILPMLQETRDSVILHGQMQVLQQRLLSKETRAIPLSDEQFETDFRGLVAQIKTLSETTYVSLAQNLDVEFRLGWHVLRNMDSEIGSSSIPQRDEEERDFFSKGIWRTLPEDILGITPLRERLSKLLLAQIGAELPSLVEEIGLKSAACRTELQRLGQPRTSIEEQRHYLLSLSQTCQSLIKAAVDGTYNDEFFGDARTTSGYQKRIRAVVQNLGESFAEAMVCEGHRYVITSPSDEDYPQTRSLEGRSLSRSTFLKHIETLMKRIRGRELPGTFNPMIVSDLFFEQSLPWERLARSHITRVTDAVRIFLKDLTSHVADFSARGALFEKLVEPMFEKIVKDVEDKTEDLLAPHQHGHPITYNHDFTETVQEVRKDRTRAEFTGIIKDVFSVDSLYSHEECRCKDTEYRPLLNALTAHNNPDMIQNACSNVLDCMQAYYRVGSFLHHSTKAFFLE
jgi:hypothetical protein